MSPRRSPLKMTWEAVRDLPPCRFGRRTLLTSHLNSSFFRESQYYRTPIWEDVPPKKSVMCLHVPYFDDGFAFPRVFVFLFVSVVFSTFFSTSSILARHKDVLPVVQRHPLHRSWRVYCVLSYYFCLPSRYRGVLLFPGPRHRRRLSCPSLLTCFPLFL